MMGKLRHPMQVLIGTILAALAVILLLVPATGVPQSDANKSAGTPTCSRISGSRSARWS